ncbi:hypothetical protein OUZ56_033319 [Daphnia magna]|uniref:Uncharacterized protein n=1 Tax=Daphnia magna TaxID=35525 RepID=A0ABQ9ZXL1_9CRUS|nr:hypothetical protein OUZ56_033319 [Daphnia magna]
MVLRNLKANLIQAQLHRDGLLPAWVEPPRPPPARERIPDEQLPAGAHAPSLQPFLEIARRLITVEQLEEATRPRYYGDIHYAPPGIPVVRVTRRKKTIPPRKRTKADTTSQWEEQLISEQTRQDNCVATSPVDRVRAGLEETPEEGNKGVVTTACGATTQSQKLLRSHPLRKMAPTTKGSRTAVKGHITKTINLINGLKAVMTQEELSNLEILETKLKGCYETYKEYSTAIQDELNDADAYQAE